MRPKLMHKILNVAGYVYSELSEDDFACRKDLGREFFKFMKSKFISDSFRKVKVSDFIRHKIMQLDAAKFDEKYRTSLATVKKSKDQLEFLTTVVTQMFRYSSKNDVLDW